MTTLNPFFMPEPTTPRERTIFEEIMRFGQSIRAILNRGIRFEDNFDCRLVTVTTDATPDTETAVAHTLGKVPTGYILIGKDLAGDVYTSTGGTAWTTTNIYVKCTVASVTVKLIVF